MREKGIVFRLTLEIDDKWASNLSRDELIDTVESRLNRGLGFRGRVRRLRIIGDKRNDGA